MIAWKKKQVRRPLRAVPFWLSTLLSCAVVSLYLLSRPEIRLIPPIDLLELIEARTVDLRFLLRGQRSPPGNEIVIIAVDERTEDELGRWQSAGRGWIAEMLTILHTGGANVIGFDFTLAEPDEHDRQLADAIQRADNVVLGIYHYFNQADAVHLTPEKQDEYAQRINRVKYSTIRFPPGITAQQLQLLHSFGVEPAQAIFSEAARSSGHFTTVPDRDGYIRQAPLLVEYRGDYYPSLSLEVARLALNSSLPPVIHALGQEGGGSIATIQIGAIRIPTDGQGRLCINYYGPARTFPYYSLSDVVLGRIPPDTFHGKIALVGFTASIYQDIHSIPFQNGLYPGVEVHATIVENILHRDFLTKPEWTILIDPGLILLLGIFLGIVLPRMHPVSGAFIMVLCLIGIAGLTCLAFLFADVWLNLSFPIGFILPDYLVITSYQYFVEEKREAYLKNAFQHYVAPTVVEQLLETADSLKLGGERKYLTALLVDIQDFTKISEHLDPEIVVKFLNEFFTALTATVLHYEGTVNKFMGDALLAFYGAPLAQPDHAARACRTAVEMLTRLNTLQPVWQARGLPLIKMGVGINSGEMIVGNIGSENQFDYTIIGDHVNLTSRLEDLTEYYRTSIIVSQATYELLPKDAFTVRELDTVRVRGRETPVTMYHLIGTGVPDQQTRIFLNTFQQGLAAYKTRQWDQAIALFLEVLAINPEDKPCCTLYIERCGKYAHIPPPEDWDGVFEMKTK